MLVWMRLSHFNHCCITEKKEESKEEAPADVSDEDRKVIDEIRKYIEYVNRFCGFSQFFAISVDGCEFRLTIFVDRTFKFSAASFASPASYQRGNTTLSRSQRAV